MPFSCVSHIAICLTTSDMRLHHKESCREDDGDKRCVTNWIDAIDAREIGLR